MRIVLDTNVVVSSLWGGPPKSVMNACRRGRVKLLLSRPILEEYFTVLSRFEIEEDDMDLFESLFTDPRRTEMVSPSLSIRAVKEDPSDDKFLECAVSGRAEGIVSGDRHLLALGEFRGIPIMSPRRFLEMSRPAA